MIVFASCVADDEKFRRCAIPGMQLAMEPDSLFVKLSHPTSIFAAYNALLDHVATMDGVEGVVLLHEDVEIRDPAFCAKVRAVLAEPDVAVAGVVGAVDVTSIAWWEGTCFGRVGESRGPIDFGGGIHDVAVVDGLLLALSPWAVHNLRFDSTTFTGWHAYDADICTQALATGRRVMVFETDVFHHTKGGFGDPAAWLAADEAWKRKWHDLLVASGADPAPGTPTAPTAPAAPVAAAPAAAAPVASAPFAAAAPAAGRRPSCSIVIPLYGRADLTAQCLDHLARTIPHDVEIVLVDNASPDDTRQLLGLLGDRATILMERTNGGFARGSNRGALVASGDVLVFLNNDTIPHQGWLEPLLDAVSEPGVLAAGPKLLFPDGTIQHAGVGFFDCMPTDIPGYLPFGPSLIGYRQPGDTPLHNERRDVTALTGACMCVRRDAFLAAGGFDEAYWNGYEDVDLSVQLRLLGGRLVYEPTSVLVHLESASGPERHRAEDRNLELFTQRWRGTLVPDWVRIPDGRLVSLPVPAPAQGSRDERLARWRADREDLLRQVVALVG